MTWSRLRFSRITETIRRIALSPLWAIITRSIPISGASRAAASAARNLMDKEAPSGYRVSAEICEECGEDLGGKGITFYDGVNWRRVHSACVPEKSPEL